MTERLVLRPWEPTDLGAAREWHGDERVMRYLGGALPATSSDATVRRWSRELMSRRYGMLAVCLRGTGRPIGAVGIGHPAFRARFTPCVEIGWRLVAAAWGHGYATEAAAAVLRDSFARLDLREIVAFGARDNVASLRVMRRLGMHYDERQDFTRRFETGLALPSTLWRIRRDHMPRRDRTPARESTK